MRLLMAALIAIAAHWPQFRGPSASGRADGAHLPDTWSAADGKLYLPSEDGDVLVVRAGPRFELIATNPKGQPLMATPAITDGLLLVRGERELFAVGALTRR